MIQAIIFDFDGLIMETEVAVLEAWQETFAAHGGSLAPSVWADSIGSSHVFDPYEHLASQLGTEVDRAAVGAHYRALLNKRVADEPLLPGVQEYLDDARDLGLRLAVASSSGREWVEGHLRRHNLIPYFDCIRCAEDVKQTKPDPALFLTALETLGVAASEAIVLEDSPHGIAAARAAGIFCVAVPGPLTIDRVTGIADLQLSSLTDMPLRDLLRHVERQATVNGKG